MTARSVNASHGFKINQGFTLVEILIAMTILFATIVSGLMAYQNALSGSERAGQAMVLLAQVTPVQQHIRQQLMAEPLQMSGRGNFGEISFEWHAELDSFKSPPDRFDADTGDFVEEPPRFRLQTVTLTLYNQQRQRSFHYQELTWLARYEN